MLHSLSQALQDCRQILSFEFARVFGKLSSQEEVFDSVGKPAVEDLLRGTSGCVLAYGMTGSGKTFTMQGPSYDSLMAQFIARPELVLREREREVKAAPGLNASALVPASASAVSDPGAQQTMQAQAHIQAHRLRGVLPRVVEHLFALIRRAQQPAQQQHGGATPRFTVQVSFYEIYKGRIRDLLTRALRSLCLITLSFTLCCRCSERHGSDPGGGVQLQEKDGQVHISGLPLPPTEADRIRTL